MGRSPLVSSLEHGYSFSAQHDSKRLCGGYRPPTAGTPYSASSRTHLRWEQVSVCFVEVFFEVFVLMQHSYPLCCVAPDGAPNIAARVGGLHKCKTFAFV